jgi:hypothetical protein
MPFEMKPWTGPSLVSTTGLNLFSVARSGPAAAPAHDAHSVPSATAIPKLKLAFFDVLHGREVCGYGPRGLMWGGAEARRIRQQSMYRSEFSSQLPMVGYVTAATGVHKKPAATADGQWVPGRAKEQTSEE